MPKLPSQLLTAGAVALLLMSDAWPVDGVYGVPSVTGVGAGAAAGAFMCPVVSELMSIGVMSQSESPWIGTPCTVMWMRMCATMDAAPVIGSSVPVHADVAIGVIVAGFERSVSSIDGNEMPLVGMLTAPLPATVPVSVGAGEKSARSRTMGASLEPRLRIWMNELLGSPPVGTTVKRMGTVPDWELVPATLRAD